MAHVVFTEFDALAGVESADEGVSCGLSDKMCVCYRRVAGLDVAFLDAD